MLFRTGRIAAAVIVLLCGPITACNRAPEPAHPAETNAADGSGPVASAETGGFAIAFDTDPDPPRSGDNSLTVTVKQADGTAVTDADVSVTFYMPAMPSMNMPEMRDTAQLTHESSGRYRGENHLVMAGTWNVTVAISRDGRKIGGSKFSVIAK